MNGRDLLAYLGSFWTDQFEDTKVLERLMDGYIEVVRNLYAEIHRLGFAQSLELHPGAKSDLWVRFPFEEVGSEKPIDADIISIPTLQNRFKSPTVTLVEGTDYTVSSGQVFFVTTIPSEPMWAPYVLRKDTSVWGNLGTVVELEQADLSTVTDTRQALRIIQAVWHAYRRGPTIYNMRVGANALAGLPFTDFPGRITNIIGSEFSDKTVEVTWGDLGAGIVGSRGDRFIAGVKAYTSETAVAEASGNWIYDDAASPDWVVGDYVSILTAGHELDATVEELHSVASSTTKVESSTGTTDSTGRILSDADSSDFSSVATGDVVEITQPTSRSGYYRIRKAAAGQVETDEIIGRNLTNVRYTILRRPGVRISLLGPRRVSGLSWRVVRPKKAWPNRTWEGQVLWDSSGRRFAIIDNDASSLILEAPDPDASVNSWAHDGPFRIKPPFEATTKGSYALSSSLSPMQAAGEYVRRFEPLSDGVEIKDWRTANRYQRYQRPLVVITADTDGTDQLTVNTTLGIAKNDHFFVEDVDSDPVEIKVSSVVSSTVIQADRTVPAGYTVAKFARLRPSRSKVEGLSGFYKIADPSQTGSTDGGDGTQFVDANATFQTHGLLVDDQIRIIQSDGTIELAAVASVDSETQLTLTTDIGAGRSNLYYMVVVPYSAGDYFRMTVQLATETVQSTDVIEAFLKRIKPGFIAFALSPLVQDIYESEKITELSPVLFNWTFYDPAASGSLTGGSDETGDNFLTGGLDEMAQDVDNVFFEQLVEESIGGDHGITGILGNTGVSFFTGALHEVSDYFTNHNWRFEETVSRPTETILPYAFSVEFVEGRRVPSKTGSTDVTGSSFASASVGSRTLEDDVVYNLV